MSIPSSPKSYLDRITKDTTILGVFVILLFAEVSHQFYFSKSLISENVSLSVLLSFPLIFSFVVFILSMKMVFTLVFLILGELLNKVVHAVDFELSYEVSFGSFLSGVLLIAHGITTDHTNLLTQYTGLNMYSIFSVIIGVIMVLLIIFCNWESNEKSKPKKA